MSLLSFLLKNKLLFLALLAIPLLIYFLVLNDKAQKRFSQAALTQQQVSNNTPQQSSQDRLVETAEHRLPLSQDDFYAKSNVLTNLPPDETSGVVYQSEKVTIEYIESADTFQAEILTQDVAGAKSEASSWFQSQGMSQEGICNIPLSFYLNFNIKNELGTEAGSFNPLPDGC